MGNLQDYLKKRAKALFHLKDRMKDQRVDFYVDSKGKPLGFRITHANGRVQEYDAVKMKYLNSFSGYTLKDRLAESERSYGKQTFSNQAPDFNYLKGQNKLIVDSMKNFESRNDDEQIVFDYAVKLAKEGKPLDRYPSIWTEIGSPELLRKLYTDHLATGKDFYRHNIAKNLRCPLDVLKLALHDPNWEVRRTAVKRPDVPIAWCYQLASVEQDPRVKEALETRIGRSFAAQQRAASTVRQAPQIPPRNFNEQRTARTQRTSSQPLNPAAYGGGSRTQVPAQGNRVPPRSNLEAGWGGQPTNQGRETAYGRSNGTSARQSAPATVNHALAAATANLYRFSPYGVEQVNVPQSVYMNTLPLPVAAFIRNFKTNNPKEQALFDDMVKKLEKGQPVESIHGTLAQIGSSSVLTYLYNKEPNPFIRESVLKNFRCPPKLVAQALRDPSWAIRKAAVFNNTLDKSQYIDLAKRETHPLVQEALKACLGNDYPRSNFTQSHLPPNASRAVHQPAQFQNLNQAAQQSNRPATMRPEPQGRYIQNNGRFEKKEQGGYYQGRFEQDTGARKSRSLDDMVRSAAERSAAQQSHQPAQGKYMGR